MINPTQKNPIFPSALCSIYALLAFVGLLGSYATHRAIVVICVAAALGLIISLGPRLIVKKLQSIPKTPLLLWAALLLWVAFGSFWSPVEIKTMVSALKLFAASFVCFVLISGASYLQPGQCRHVLVVLALGVVFLGVLWILDVVTEGILSFHEFRLVLRGQYGFFWFKAAVTLFALSGIIIAYACLLHSRFNLAVLMLIFVFCVVAAMESRTLTFSILIALAASPIFLLFRRYSFFVPIFCAVIFTVFCVSFFGTLWVPEDISRHLEPGGGAASSVMYRSYIWEYVSGLIRDAPIFGYGLGASGYFGNEENTFDPYFGFVGELIPSHPHNVSLQLWFELGLIGYGIVIALCWSTTQYFNQVLSRHVSGKIALMTIVLIVLALWHFNYGAFASWWLQQLGFVATMFVIAHRSKDPGV